MPTPAGLVVKNGSKIRGSTLAGMPTPVSSISTYDARGVGMDAHADLVRVDVAVLDRVRGVDQQVQEHLTEP